MFFKKNLTTAAICAALSVAAFSAMATDSTDTELTIIGEYTPCMYPSCYGRRHC